MTVYEAYEAYRHAVQNGPFPEGETKIATDTYYSYYYAFNVLEGPF